jgi:uncharacterized protein
MLIDGEFAVTAPPEALMQHLFDARLMASCLPGCEQLEALDPDRYRAVIGVALAGIEARFDMEVRITRRDAHNIWAAIRGEEGGRASTLQADTQIELAAAPEGTRVRYRAELSITGRLGRFALGMMKKKAQALGLEFATNLQRQLQRASASAGSEVDGLSPQLNVLPLPLAGERALLPLPPGEGGGEGPHGARSHAPALTPALSQREREPNRAASPLDGADAAAQTPARPTWWRSLVLWWRGMRARAAKVGG